MSKRHVSFDLWMPDAPGALSFARRYLVPHPGTLIVTLLVVALLYAGGVAALPYRAPMAAPSASTNTIAYQGRLADTGGNPLTGTYNMIFRLYNVATGGTPLWEEQWTGSNSARVSDGLFNVMLGSLTQIPQSVVTGNNTLWLGITVGTDNEMSPRVQLGSVPFAVQALTVPDGSITTAKVAAAAITTTQLMDKSVTQVKLGADVSLVPLPGSVTTTMIADGAVTQAKLADDTLVRTLAPVQEAKVQFGSQLFPSGDCILYVTYTQPFAQPPLVVITQNEASAGPGNFVIGSVSSTSFRVVKNPAPANCTTLGWVNWIALGN